MVVTFPPDLERRIIALAALKRVDPASFVAALVAEAYAAIDFFLKSQGIKMGNNDLWIAAAAYISGA